MLLARGQRFGPGEIVYVLTYFSDHAATGNLATTTSPKHGQLVVFSWAPVQWDEPLEPEAGPRFLVVRAHKEGLSTREKFLLTYYVPADRFPAAGLSAQRLPAEQPGRARAGRPGLRPPARRLPPWRAGRARPSGRLLMLGLLGGLIATGFFIVALKHRSVIYASERIEAIQWERDDWVVPSIKMRGFRRKVMIRNGPHERASNSARPWNTSIGSTSSSPMSGPTCECGRKTAC